jgi:ribonuclease HI
MNTIYKPAIKFPSSLGDKYITLIADASYDATTTAYGWCYWIKHGSPPETIINSGGGYGLKNSNHAEIEALLEGLEIIKSLGDKLQGRFVVVQSDCTGALGK